MKFRGYFRLVFIIKYFGSTLGFFSIIVDKVIYKISKGASNY